MPVRFIEEEHPHGFWIEDFQGKPIKIPRSTILQWMGCYSPNNPKLKHKYKIVMSFDRLLSRCALISYLVHSWVDKKEYWVTWRHFDSSKQYFCFVMTDNGSYRTLDRVEETQEEVQTQHNERKPAKPVKKSPNFPIAVFAIDNFMGKSLHVTYHAIERFIGYWPCSHAPKRMDVEFWTCSHAPKSMADVREAMKIHASRAHPSNLSRHFVGRIMKHEFGLVEYFDVSDQLRFVVSTIRQTGYLVLVTIERRK